VIGRKRVLIITLVLTGVAAIILVLLRFAQGVGIGRGRVWTMDPGGARP
jgi:hypothetical protein